MPWVLWLIGELATISEYGLYGLFETRKMEYFDCTVVKRMNFVSLGYMDFEHLENLM